MKTKFIEVTNEKQNWGKFMVGRFTDEEWKYRSAIDTLLLIPARGWDSRHILVLDLQTGEGAMFMPGGHAAADLHKHQVWVCPMFEPFLNWLYKQDLSDLDKLPPLVEFSLKEAPFEMSGYRRPGPVEKK